MKKNSLILILLLLISPIFLTACGEKQFKLEDYMSEVTTTYYQAKDSEFNVSLSVGEREIDYKIDGVHGQTCGFSLVELKFNDIQEKNEIDSTLIVDAEEFNLALEFNPINNTYMGDLGFAVSKNAEIKFKVNNTTLELQNVSNGFVIDYSQAIEKSRLVLLDEIASCYNNGNFCGECYLRLLNEQNGGFDELFWIFKLVCEKGIKYDVAINAQTGEVVGVNL